MDTRPTTLLYYVEYKYVTFWRCCLCHKLLKNFYVSMHGDICAQCYHKMKHPPMMICHVETSDDTRRIVFTDIKYSLQTAEHGVYIGTEFRNRIIDSLTLRKL